MRIHQLIEELSQVETRPGHRPAYQIHRMLNANRHFFLAHVEKPDLEAIINRFESLAAEKSGYYSTEWYQREFDNAYNLLMFHLRKVV